MVLVVSIVWKGEDQSIFRRMSLFPLYVCSFKRYISLTAQSSWELHLTQTFFLGVKTQATLLFPLPTILLALKRFLLWTLSRPLEAWLEVACWPHGWTMGFSSPIHQWIYLRFRIWQTLFHWKVSVEIFDFSFSFLTFCDVQDNAHWWMIFSILFVSGLSYSPAEQTLVSFFGVFLDPPF